MCFFKVKFGGVSGFEERELLVDLIAYVSAALEIPKLGNQAFAMLQELVMSSNCISSISIPEASD